VNDQRLELERTIAAERLVSVRYATVAVLVDADEIQTAMPRILAAMGQALAWEAGTYWALDGDTGRLHTSATWSSGSAAAERFLAASRSLTFARGEGLPGAVLASGRAQGSHDLAADSRCRQADGAVDGDLRSAFLFPIDSPRRVWGVFEYMSRRDEVVDEEMRQTLTVLGRQIGRCLERLGREAELRRATAEAETAKRNLETLFEDAPAAIAILRGDELRYELSNAVNRQLAGGRSMVGKTVLEALPELEAEGVMAIVHRVYETGAPFIAREFPVTRPAAEGRPEARIFMNGVFQPLRGPTGRIEGTMLFAYDVTDLVSSRERVKEAEERLRLAVESAQIGTWDYDPRSHVVRCDDRYRRLFGLGPAAELTIETLSTAIHPDDRPRVEEAFLRAFDPSSDGHYAVDYRTRGIDDGVDRWVTMRGRTFFDEEKLPVRVVGTGLDVTHEQRLFERQQILAETSTILTSSLEYRTTLARLAGVVVPVLADWCTIELAGDGGELEQVAVAHADPAKVETARELRRRYPPDREAPSGVWRVMTTGAPVFIPRVTDEMLAQTVSEQDHLRILREMGLRSAMLLPLKVRDRVVGVLSLFQSQSGRAYTSEDLAFAGELARRAAAAIETAWLYDQAQRAIGVRDQFLSIASHELRTPLTSLMLQLTSFSRLVTAGTFASLPQQKAAERVARMEQQAERLSHLVDELLDVSRISAGRFSIDRQPTDVVEIVREVLDRFADEAAVTQSALRLTAPPSLRGSWDRNRLDQVVTNLVANAIKYASGQPIDIEVTLRDRSAVIVVRDRGPGIHETDQRRIFEQFERAAPAALAGLGLGLWIAARIVEAHGGHIRVESQPGMGASFIVEIPQSFDA
jgi:PAS domain S-box-containing protein